MRSGFISRLLGKHEKVDKQVLLDALLGVSEERDLLSVIFDTMTEGVLVFDNQECLLFANRRAGVLLRFEPTQCLNKEMLSFLRNEEVIEHLRSSLRSGDPVDGEDVFVILDGKPHALRLEITPFSDRGGRFAGILVFLLDVTEERRGKSERREALRLSTLTSLSASLAHEIRNPLNSMGIHVQLMGRKLRQEGDQESLKSVGIIQEEIRNLNEKLTRFLDAARPRQPQFDSVSLHELLEETLQLMRPELEESGIEPEYYPPSVHTTVFADRIDLRKAFVNIIKNSLEAMPSGGRLTIKIRVEEATVSITFEDTGTGIDESILDRIYEVGFSTKDIGSGLGLAQVDRCIHEHYGTIDIDSEKGEGTRIQITLPVLTQGKKLLGVTTPSETVPTDP
jgi:signal transduction histidine kinase